VTINYRQVTLSYSTHSDGGVTLKDFRGREGGGEGCVGA
jgi:pterin-4a-carbinolamine dehydratase